MSDEIREIFQRLSTVEQEFATHVAVCGERAKAMDKTLSEIREAMHQVQAKVNDLSEGSSRIRGGYVLAVGAVFFCLELAAVVIAAIALWN